MTDQLAPPSFDTLATGTVRPARSSLLKIARLPLAAAARYGYRRSVPLASRCTISSPPIPLALSGGIVVRTIVRRSLMRTVAVHFPAAPLAQPHLSTPFVTVRDLLGGASVIGWGVQALWTYPCDTFADRIAKRAART